MNEKLRDKGMLFLHMNLRHVNYRFFFTGRHMALVREHTHLSCCFIAAALEDAYGSVKKGDLLP